MKYYAGLNFDDNSIQCSIIAQDGTLLCRDKVRERGSDEVIGTMSRMISMLKQRANVVLSGVGIVLREMITYLGSDDSNAEQLAEEMQTALHIPVLFISNFNIDNFDASAFGEL